jgi:LysR family transcriptional activator of nhaA
MSALNYHHLHYFWAVAREGNLTRAAQRLHVSQSALSVQLKQLEGRLGHALFERRGRSLVLTEAGSIALNHADTIFRTGDELVATLAGGAARRREIVRVGAVSTLSRNFLHQWLKPLQGRDDVELVLRSGSQAELLGLLDAHALDVVLSNLAVETDAATPRHSQLLAEVPASLVGRRARKPMRFPDDLSSIPVALPSRQSAMRAAFDLILDRAGIVPHIAAEVDDMATLRLLARDFKGVTLVPPVVVRDELKSGALVERAKLPEIRERFYAITTRRRFPNPLLKPLLEGAEAKPVRQARIT